MHFFHLFTSSVTYTQSHTHTHTPSYSRIDSTHLGYFWDIHMRVDITHLGTEPLMENGRYELYIYRVM